MSEPYELNKRIRAVQAELDDIDHLDRYREPKQLAGLRQAVEDRLDTLLAQHRARTNPAPSSKKATP